MTQLPGLEALQQAAEQVYAVMPASPQISWPLLNARCGREVWVKHENHNPTGAFKVRGGLIYIANLKLREPETTGVCAATRGNHGQSVAYAAKKNHLSATIVVPEGNSPDKNSAMKALGAELIVYGKDFDEAVEHAAQIAAQRNLHLLPSFHLDLVKGVASYALELLSAVADLNRIYVPIGLGSGAAGVIAAKTALGLDTEIVGVVSEHANAYQLSFSAGTVISTNSADTIADGLAVRNPNQQALQVMLGGLSNIVSVSDTEIFEAISIYFTDTHNVAEGAGAAALAALLKAELALPESDPRKVGVILSGGNINKELYKQALQ